jgi:hypothetical protein
MTQTEASGSSPDTQIEEIAPAVLVTDAAPDATEVAPSTTEPQGEKPLTLLDLVRDVAAKTGEVAPPTTEEQAAETEIPSDANPAHDPNAPTPSGEKDGQEGPEEKNDEQLPFHKHPRFQELVREKNSYKEDASQFRAISDYMAENRLSADEVDKGFVIMSAIKNDPVRARAMLAETMRQLDEVTGEVLGESETRLVDEGEMSEAAAKELSRYKAQVALQEHRNQEALREQSAMRERQTEQSIISTVEQWEQQIVTRDPDYAAKKSIVFDKIRLSQLQNPAQSPQEALAYAEAAYKQATEILKAAMPKRVAINSPSSSQSVTSARAVPKSLADVVRMAAGQ